MTFYTSYTERVTKYMGLNFLWPLENFKLMRLVFYQTALVWASCVKFMSNIKKSIE